jgi:hypothetical protein
MIYQPVDPRDPIRQGDIIRRVPRVDLSLQRMIVLSRNNGDIEHVELSWNDAIVDDTVVEISTEVESERLIRAILPVSSIDAIVISQDCDAVRDEELSLCEIGRLPSVWATAKNANSPAWYAKMLTKQGTDLLKCFYLPEELPTSQIIGYSEKMAVDFSSIVRLPRTELEPMKALRAGRLNDEAYQHFREKLAEYFRRYPVDPWYPLNASEFREYDKGHGGATPPRSWQK